MIEAAAWTLLHFLWQGTVVGLLVSFHLRFMRQASTRYVVACLAMLLMLVLPLATFFGMMLGGDVQSISQATGFVSNSPRWHVSPQKWRLLKHRGWRWS